MHYCNIKSLNYDIQYQNCDIKRQKKYNLNYDKSQHYKIKSRNYDLCQNLDKNKYDIKSQHNKVEIMTN